MNNKNVSDFVAATMNAVLNSSEHKSLFDSTYKTASDQNNAKEKCEKCSMSKDSCSCGDVLKADDNEVSSSDSSSDSSCADDEDVKDSSCSADDTMESAAFDVAIDSLLTASAALDSLGMEKSATVSLKLASLIVEAKKVDKKEKDSKKSKKEKDSKKSMKKPEKGKGSKSTSTSSKSTSSKSTSTSSKSTSSKK